MSVLNLPRVDPVPLVRGIQADDPAAIETLYQVCNCGVRWHLARQIKPEDINDRLHDVFVIVLTAVKRGQIREPARLFGFMRTVLRREVAGCIAGMVRERRCADTDSLVGHALPDRKHNPERMAIMDERSEFALATLSKLYPQDREILRRFYLEEQSPEQIQQEMGLTETQYRLRKSRALGRLNVAGQRLMRKRRLTRSSLSALEAA